MSGTGSAGGDERGGELASGLDELLDVPPGDIPGALRGLGPRLGVSDITVYLSDLQQTLLVPWGAEGTATEKVKDSLAGQAFKRGEPVAAPADVWWVPIIDSGDRLGVLRLAAPAGDEATVLADARRLAALLGLLITSRRLRSDIPHVVCRAGDVSLAAELRWALLPPRSIITPAVALSGHLEPAYEIAGDAFDYALNDRDLSLAVFDAMGHGMTASRLANMAMGSYRHSRRRGRSLSEIYLDLDQAIAAEFGDELFVTAHLAHLDLDTGMFSVVNAGHPRPHLIRNGKARALEFSPATPIGLGFTTAETGRIRLQPGDSVLIVSDGVTEARSAGGDLFSTERVGELAAQAISRRETVPETVRQLVINLLDHRGNSLEDDATVVLVQWQPEGQSEGAG